MSTIEKRDEAIDLARYKQAAEEIETGNRDDALWYKAFAEGGGDDKATKATYIRLRVEQLRRAAVAASAVRVTATQPDIPVTQVVQPMKLTSKGGNTLYDILGITRNARNEEIQSGYQTQKSILDARDNQDAEDRNRSIFLQHAKEILIDPVKRAEYDARIASEVPQREKLPEKKSEITSKALSNHDLYAIYLGEKNQDYYLKKFEQFDQQGDGIHASFNSTAFLFGMIWPLYRKMYGWLLINVIVYVTLSVVSAIIWEEVWNIRQAPPYLHLLYFVLIGVFADTLYHKHVKKKIAAAKRAARDDDELVSLLISKGGVHSWVIWVVLAILIIGIIAAIVIPASSDYTKKAKAVVSEPQLSIETRNSPTSADETGWVKLLCSGSSSQATVFQFSEKLHLVRIDGTEYAPYEMNEDRIRVENKFKIDDSAFMIIYQLNRVNGELSILVLGAGSHTQYCRLSETNKF